MNLSGSTSSSLPIKFISWKSVMINLMLLTSVPSSVHSIGDCGLILLNFTWTLAFSTSMAGGSCGPGFPVRRHRYTGADMCK